ncbi:hypothetical protein PAXRUDRAFT_831712 [Paxillus rubicundulus Ve08.2h10]|uniref:Uncharacterized protein n=1 Tax=Paxillus rubicundulus Ve08.2h10 TaxID=930991 RepID=A0A0D0DWK8_9AGAM|nr:hypothetical protein PAXRUDRAFT_831712 [Paxillus rubicundulus Ve08.2h10]
MHMRMQGDPIRPVPIQRSSVKTFNQCRRTWPFHANFTSCLVVQTKARPHMEPHHRRRRSVR